MKIDKINLYHVSMPLIYPFRTACGDDYENQSVLIRLESDGMYGWGEAASGKEPTFCPECAATQFMISQEHIAPLLIGKDIGSGGNLQSEIAHIKGNRFAKGAFDLAWWDLYAKMKREPLWKMIGGRSSVVDAGADIGILETIDDLIETVRDAVKRGYKRVKLKYRPGWEIDMVGAVRDAFPGLTLHIDCNSSYTLNDVNMFERLDMFNLAMIEQPLAHDDLIDHAELAHHIRTPICLDESINSPDKARKAVRIYACRWINIKPGRVGGITPSLVIHDICQEAGVGCWIGGMLESSIGAMHCLALATLPNIKYPSDIFPTGRFYDRDLGIPRMEHSSPSQFTVSKLPGVGAEPDPEMLERCTVQNAEIL